MGALLSTSPGLALNSNFEFAIRPSLHYSLDYAVCYGEYEKTSGVDHRDLLVSHMPDSNPDFSPVPCDPLG